MDKSKKTLNEIGLKYTIFAVLVVGMQFAVARYLKTYKLGWLKDNAVFASYMLSLVCNDFLGLSAVYLLTRKTKKRNITKEKLGVGNFLKIYAIGIFFVFAGGLLGNIIQMVITGKMGNAASDLVSSGSDVILGAFVVGLCAPVFEELIFRKFLIDCLSDKGELLAAVISGLFFGLFHGNLSQFFFAASIGFLFAVVYIKTGNILYTIVLHMSVNIPSTIAANAGNEMVAFYGLYMIVIAIIGCVLFFMNLKMFKLNNAGDKPTKVISTILTSWGVWLFIIACGVIFYITYS